MITESTAQLVYRGLEGCKFADHSLEVDTLDIHEEVRSEDCRNGCGDVADCEGEEKTR